MKLDSGRSRDVVENVALTVKQAFYLTEDGVKLPDRLRALGCPVSHLDARDIREVGKVANYWRISRHLAICSQRFRACFANAAWTSIPGYRYSTTSEVQPRQFVHAEIQLLVHHELAPSQLMPRTIGVSKEACFLCDSFIQAHGQFSITGAHRQIFPQWTVPDLEEYNSQTTRRFRLALSQVVAEVKEEFLKSARNLRCRPFPLQSAINLGVVHLATPSDSALSTHSKNSDQDVSVTGSRDHSDASIPSQQETNELEKNTRDSLEETDSTFTPNVNKRRSHREQVGEAPVTVTTDVDVDWIDVFAATRTLQQTDTSSSIHLEAALPSEGLQRVHLADLEETQEIVLERGPMDVLQELSFLLVGLERQEVRVRCRWH